MDLKEIKIIFNDQMKKKNITKAELARRMGLQFCEMTRLCDPKMGTSFNRMVRALEAVGLTLKIKKL